MNRLRIILSSLGKESVSDICFGTPSLPLLKSFDFSELSYSLINLTTHNTSIGSINDNGVIDISNIPKGLMLYLY